MALLVTLFLVLVNIFNSVTANAPKVRKWYFKYFLMYARCLLLLQINKVYRNVCMNDKEYIFLHVMILVVQLSSKAAVCLLLY